MFPSSPPRAAIGLALALLLIVTTIAAPARTTAGAAAAQQTPAAGTQVVPDCDPAQRTCNTYVFGGGWVADPDASMTGQGGAFAVEHQVLANTTFQYFEMPWVANHVPDNAALLEGFALAILSQLGQAAPAPVATGTLADGSLWHLYTVPIGPDPYGMLFTADTADPSQNDVSTILTSPAATFDQGLAAVQADILVNGVSPLAGIDPVEAMTALGGGAPVPPPPGTTPTVSPPPAAPGGALDQTATVGSDTIAYGGDWTFDPANSSLEFATFRTTLDPRVTFTYGQGADRMSGGDVQVALQILDPPTAFEATNAQQVSVEVLPSGRIAVLYRWERAGTPEAALFVMDVTTTPGTIRMQVLFAPPDAFLASVTSVQQSFLVNGEAPFAELDAATLATALGGGPGTTPAVNPTPTPWLVLPPLGGTTTPAPAPTPTTAPTPTVAAGQTVTVAGATITYAGGWVYDTVNSTPDEIAFFDNNAVTEGFYGYRAVPDTSGDALLALRQFNDTYLRNFGVTNDRVVAEESLPGGQAWVLHTADLQGLPIVVLTYADVTTAPGQFRLQLLVTTAAEFNAALVDAQASIRIDGQPAYAGLDPAALAALLGGAPSTPVTGAASVFRSEQYGYTLTYDPAVWTLTPDDDGDAEEWVGLDSETSAVTLLGRPSGWVGSLEACVTSYLVDYGWDDGVWEATPIQPVSVEADRARGTYTLEDQVLGTGTAYMSVECRAIGGDNTLLIAHFAYTDAGEPVPADDVAAVEQLMAGLVIDAPAGTAALTAAWARLGAGQGGGRR